MLIANIHHHIIILLPLLLLLLLLILLLVLLLPCAAAGGSSPSFWMALIYGFTSCVGYGLAAQSAEAQSLSTFGASRCGLRFAVSNFQKALVHVGLRLYRSRASQSPLLQAERLESLRDPLPTPSPATQTAAPGRCSEAEVPGNPDGNQKKLK